MIHIGISIAMYSSSAWIESNLNRWSWNNGIMLASMPTRAWKDGSGDDVPEQLQNAGQDCSSQREYVRIRKRGINQIENTAVDLMVVTEI